MLQVNNPDCKKKQGATFENFRVFDSPRETFITWSRIQKLEKHVL